MSSHYSFYDNVAQVIPYTRRYTYPTQSNRAWKSVIKVPPKNGQTFLNTSTTTPIRFELPAQGYMNTRNTFLQFDLAMGTTGSSTNLRMQNNVQCFMKRVRFTYGSLVVEDIREYHNLVRILTEGTGTNTSWVSDQVSINEGIGGIKMYPIAGLIYSAGNENPFMAVPENVRLSEIQCANITDNLHAVVPTYAQSTSQGSISGNGLFRRYCVQLALGTFQQNKLIPLKWMSSQLSIEIEVCTISTDCMASTGVVDNNMFYTLTNMAMLLELLEFDGAYDEEFLEEGLRKEGVPIKIASWDTFINTPANSTSQQILIPERNRSLKAVFVVQIPPSRNCCTATAFGSELAWDSSAFLESSANLSTATGLSTGALQDWQLRVGGKMYPANVVRCNNGSLTNGAPEAYMEFAKALNIVGDYRLSTGISASRWTRPLANATGQSCAIDFTGCREVNDTRDLENYVRGPSSFVIGIDLETSDGTEVSGLNGEEQNDLQLFINYTQAQSLSCYYLTYVFWDGLLILKENNLLTTIK